MPSLEEKVEHLLIEVQDLRDRIADLERTRNRARTAVIGPGRFPPKEEQGMTTIPVIDPSLRKMLDDYAKKHNLP
jgi:hypothetical protein